MKPFLIMLGLLLAAPLRAWWDPGHLVVAMIAYAQLDEQARERVDALTRVLERDYPYVNHFMVTGAWPDDLKAEGVRAYDTWHYTNIPYNPDGLALPPRPEVDVIWAIEEARSILGDRRARDLDKARFLGFLVHFVGDLHQPMHSTTRYTHALPGGNRGGNGFTLKGSWNNLHALWDDGCGALSDYLDIRPYGKPKQPLTRDEIRRIRDLADWIMARHPAAELPEAARLDPDFWALESHHLAIRFGYRAVNDPEGRGSDRYLQPGDEPSATYLGDAQAVVWRQLALAGYRLGSVLNELFSEG